MKKFVVGGAVLALAITPLAACGGGSADPEVEREVQKIERQHPEATREQVSQAREGLQDLKEQINDLYESEGR